MKKIHICLLLTTLLSACEKDEPVSADPSVPEAPSGTTVKVNFADSGLPVLNIKRGY